MVSWNIIAIVQLPNTQQGGHSKSTQCANRANAQLGMKIVITGFRKGSSDFHCSAWSGKLAWSAARKSIPEPQGVCKDHESFLTSKGLRTMAIPVEDRCFGCPKPHHCTSLPQGELWWGNLPLCSDAQYSCAEETSTVHEIRINWHLSWELWHRRRALTLWEGKRERAQSMCCLSSESVSPSGWVRAPAVQWVPGLWMVGGHTGAFCAIWKPDWH